MFQEYLAELSKLRLLGAEEERALWHSFKEEGKRESRQCLIESYQPLVLKLAMRFATDEPLCLELIQEGTLGLIEAVEGFSPARDIKFSTYAQYRIRGRMLDFLRRAARPSQSALMLASFDGEIDEFLSLVHDDRAEVEEEVDRRAILSALRQALSRLTDRERQVVEGIYLDGLTPLEVAARLGISPSYLYKTQKKALRRLRGLLARVRAELKAPG